MAKIYFLVIIVLSNQFSFGQINHPINKQDLIVVCTKFMETFKSEKYTEAFDLLKPYSVIEDYKMDTMAIATPEQMKTLSGSYGKMISFEQLSAKEVKGSLVKLVYLLKFEQYYLKFCFILYNNGGGWTITNFKYNDEIDDLFDASLK